MALAFSVVCVALSLVPAPSRVVDPAGFGFSPDVAPDANANALQKTLDGKAYLYHWRHFVHSLAINEAAFNDVATLAIVSNNGLHSLDRWTPDKVSDGQIADVTRAIVRAFRKGAPQAALVWLSTTPPSPRRC